MAVVKAVHIFFKHWKGTNYQLSYSWIGPGKLLAAKPFAAALDGMQITVIYLYQIPRE